MKPFRLSLLFLGLLFLSGCETMNPEAANTSAMNAAIAQEPPGNYFIGRRMYKQDYKVWGWVREPGKPWKTAQLVMLNEQRKLAPDRAINQIGSDNNTEYRLTGYFSGEKVYEPASDGIYPEFILIDYQVKQPNAPNIYQTKRQNDPAVRVLQPPA